MKTYKIYCLKNEQNEIVYVGQTERNLKVRLSEHKRRFSNRVNYTIHLLEETDNIRIADELETEYITKFNTVECGENTTYGKGRKGLGKNETSFKEGNEFSKLGTKKVECIDTGEIFNSITECAEKLGLNTTNISAVCRGKRKTTGKMRFRYV